MKIRANITKFEAQTLFDILHNEIIKYSLLSKSDFLAGEINKSRHRWNEGHAKHLEKIRNKLLVNKI